MSELTLRERAALHHHLGYNQYPPVLFMYDASVSAIHYARTGETVDEGAPEGYVKAPPEICGGRTDGYVPADEVIENCHLEFFLEDDDGDS